MKRVNPAQLTNHQEAMPVNSSLPVNCAVETSLR